MKHRIGGQNTGLGGNSVTQISGKNSSNLPDSLFVEIADDCYDVFSFEQFGRCEAGFDGNEARFGVEATYQFDPIKIILIHKNKQESKYITGRAVEAWASRCIYKIKEYADYKNKSKFVKFVDKWHSRIFNPELTNQS